MIKVAIVGSTGYTGAELVRLLSHHPEVEIVALTSQSYVDQAYEEVYPSLTGQVGLSCQAQDIEALMNEADVVFLALPHGLSVPWAQEAYRQGKKVIDLGADFRFREVQTYENWYKTKHEAPDLLSQAVYGLPELNRHKIRESVLVANPGCYPTASILGLAPLLQAKVINPKKIIIDAKSGVSGAGRSAKLGSLYGEVNENVKAYGVATHRHTPEIEQEIAALLGMEAEKVKLSFTPHLMPMTRGILSTIYGELLENLQISAVELRQIYKDFYDKEPFIHITEEDQWPQTKWCYGSNHVFIGLTVDPRTHRVIVTTAIDNLVKGAAGQAIQNMNILFDLPETKALERPGIWP
ncbi:N-acetyl-gamma-glutamyl-phosphate reductase [Heliorestis acidaminivorans]|uniref:N-acetyl-gamma-glutamyl-phosphate reductase n=1 Tax=Heliorestis acidaminivorans TaxID=553427 RepID=A0A6I0EXT6_9FIRM|nr:N-acetyl-gamma-glutamyl-phosphate reductase [Heliorestis acidaminivorans]KAB2951375.1 N-acetyl-gamma-glutamyl-phosphate reductase [Heliorestis acidaminivorans]